MLHRQLLWQQHKAEECINNIKNIVSEYFRDTVYAVSLFIWVFTIESYNDKINTVKHIYYG